MAHWWRRFYTGIIIIMIAGLVPQTQAAPWGLGLEILVAITPVEAQELAASLAQLNRLLALTIAQDHVTIVTGPSSDQQLQLSNQRSIDEATWERLCRVTEGEKDLAALHQLLTVAADHFAQPYVPGRQPLLFLLDHSGLVGAEDEPEINRLLNQLERRHILLGGIGIDRGSQLGGLLEAHHGLSFAPESEAALHRAMVSLLAEARGSARLPIVDGYLPVDESCQQLSLLLSGPDGPPLVARPNGSLLEMEQEQSLRTDGGAGITITIVDPEPGYWRVLGEGWSGEAILTSPLRLGHVPILPSYAVGESITLLAYLADGDRLSPDQYPNMMAMRAQLLGPSQAVDELIFYDDGQHGDGTARDGLYGAQIRLNIPGPYQLSYQIKRGLLERQETVSFRIVEPDGQERRYTLAPELINLPRLVPGRTYQQTITLTSHLAKAERFRFVMGDDETDLRSFGKLVVSPSEVELQPGESRTITLSVRLEPKAALGGYAGHLRLVPVNTTQRGQIVPLRLGVVPWPVAYWHWLATAGAVLFTAMLTASMVLSRPELRGWLSNETLGGRERVPLHGHHFLPSPTSHRSYLTAVRSGGEPRVHLCVDRHDPPVLVNGLPVTRRTPLSDGDRLRFGQSIWEYREEQVSKR